MAKQTIDIGTGPDDNTGDHLRSAFTKVNDNFDELYLATSGSGITAIVEDIDPHLGGALVVNGHAIVSATAGDIAITPDTIGDLILDGLKWPQADGTADYVLKTDGAGQLSWVSTTHNHDANYTSKEIVVNYQSGIAYTAILTDSDGMIVMDNAVANTVTIPANASVAYPIGTKLNFMQLGTGATTIAITTDTLNVNAALTLVLGGQFAVATAIKMASTTWVLFGNLESV